jgi:hypothetical protein
MRRVTRILLPAIAQNIERERQERVKALAEIRRQARRAERQRSGGVEKYRSIASRQALEHGSTAISPGPDSRISAAVFWA